MRGGTAVSAPKCGGLPMERSGVQINATADNCVEIAAPLGPIPSSAVMSIPRLRPHTVWGR